MTYQSPMSLFRGPSALYLNLRSLKINPEAWGLHAQRAPFPSASSSPHHENKPHKTAGRSVLQGHLLTFSSCKAAECLASAGRACSLQDARGTGAASPWAVPHLFQQLHWLLPPPSELVGPPGCPQYDILSAKLQTPSHLDPPIISSVLKTPSSVDTS